MNSTYSLCVNKAQFASELFILLNYKRNIIILFDWLSLTQDLRKDEILERKKNLMNLWYSIASLDSTVSTMIYRYMTYWLWLNANTKGLSLQGKSSLNQVEIIIYQVKNEILPDKTRCDDG